MPLFYTLAATAAAIGLTAAATAAASGEQAGTATVAEQDQQDDDPPDIATEIVVTHKKYLQIIFRSPLLLIPRYSKQGKRCKKGGLA